jgi:hypothetical protein
VDIPAEYTKKFRVTKTEDWRDVCASLAKVYGRGVWKLIATPGVTEQKLIVADTICQKNGKKSFGYFRAVVLGLGRTD